MSCIVQYPWFLPGWVIGAIDITSRVYRYVNRLLPYITLYMFPIVLVGTCRRVSSCSKWIHCRIPPPYQKQNWSWLTGQLGGQSLRVMWMLWIFWQSNALCETFWYLLKYSMLFHHCQWIIPATAALLWGFIYQPLLVWAYFQKSIRAANHPFLAACF